MPEENHNRQHVGGFDFNLIEEEDFDVLFTARIPAANFLQGYKNGELSADNLQHLGESLINRDLNESDKDELERDLLSYIASHVDSDKEFLFDPIPSNKVVRTLGKELLYRSADVETHKKRGYLDAACNHRLSESDLNELFKNLGNEEKFGDYSVYEISDKKCLLVLPESIASRKCNIPTIIPSDVCCRVAVKELIVFQREIIVSLADEDIPCELIRFRGLYNLCGSRLERIDKRLNLLGYMLHKLI